MKKNCQKTLCKAIKIEKVALDDYFTISKSTVSVSLFGVTIRVDVNLTLKHL